MTSSKFVFAILTFLLACGLADSAAQDNKIVNPSALTVGNAMAASVSTANTALSLSDMTALTQIDEAIWGAGKSQIAQFDVQGNILKSSALPLSQVAGIAAYEGGTILVGSSSENTIYKFDPISSSVQKFLDLRQIDSSGVLAGDVLQNGELISIASDGIYVFAAIRAGYSSSIFKIDPTTGKIISRAWAPGPNPSIMAYNAGSLFVLDESSKQLRRFDSDMMLSDDAVFVADRKAKGILAADSAVQILSTESNKIRVTPVNAAAMVASMPIGIADRSIAGSKVSLDTVAAAIAQGSKIAVLICGDMAENGFEEFWSDTCWMYKSLRDAGYSAENIYVLYGNGNDHASENPKYQSADTVTDFPATYVWVDKVFDGLMNGDSTNGISKMKSSDSLFVWTFDHGAGGDPAYLCLMDGAMDEGHFAGKLNALPFQKAAIFMQQCRSGGFIDSLQGSKVFLSTACRSDQNAFPSNNEYETYNGQIYNHGEYNYYLISAISGMAPNGATINADTGGDSGISALEAHNWVANHEDLAEVPQMSDTGGVGSTFIIKPSTSGGIKFVKPEEALIREVIPIPKPIPDPIVNRLSKMPKIV